ncbi:MAG: hypothetical protein DI539_14925 [Flavobacterium psychrophilum]|nr:MAG: hypothetical protein DI539_14925 [Flavobacterium psychrophilum]
MKKYILILLLLVNGISFSQTLKSENFISGSDSITYSSIDYSKHGVAQVFITLYEGIESNTAIPDKAKWCLSKEINIYHTYYYFIKLPRGTTQLQGEIIFSDFVKHLSEIEKIDSRTVIYLNSDKDYSSKYNDQTIKPYNIIRTLTQTTPNNICSRLNIERRK